jgi:plastocyanin
MLRIRAIVPALCALAIAACGGSSSGGAYSTDPGGNNGPTNNPPNNNPVATNAVTLTTAAFMPGNISVPKGATVTWTWDSCTSDPYAYGGSTCVAHNITFDDGTSSSSQSTGSFTRQFDVAGTFKYHCAIHGPAMSGQVVVQ